MFLVEVGLFIKIIEKLFKIIIMEYFMNAAALQEMLRIGIDLIYSKTRLTI